MAPASISQHYAEDHQQLDALFHRFQNSKSSDPSGAQKAFQDFKTGLERLSSGRSKSFSRRSTAVLGTSKAGRPL